MNNLLQLVSSFFVNSLWEIAAIGGVGWIASRLLRRLGPNVQHSLWVTTLLLAVATPTLPLLHAMAPKGGFGTLAQNHSLIISVATPQDQLAASNSLVLPPVLILTLFFLFLGALVWFAIRLSWSLHYTITLRREACPSKERKHVDLSCTYYEKGIGRDGTCETHEGDKAHYYCSPNADRKLSQEQSSCEWKIQRAKALGVKGLEK